MVVEAQILANVSSIPRRCNEIRDGCGYAGGEMVSQHCGLERGGSSQVQTNLSCKRRNCLEV